MKTRGDKGQSSLQFREQTASPIIGDEEEPWITAASVRPI
jgi:hypothetical protein